MLQLRKRWLFFFLLFHFLIPGKMAFAEEGSWIIKKGEWTYVNGYGKVIPGWVEYKGGWYFINAGRERMASGWIFDKGKWYFLSTNQKDLGKMQRFWATIDGYAYFFDENGAMAEKAVIQGKYAVNDKGQYLGEDGQPKYYEKSGFRTKPGTMSLWQKQKKKQLSCPKLKSPEGETPPLPLVTVLIRTELMIPVPQIPGPKRKMSICKNTIVKMTISKIIRTVKTTARMIQTIMRRKRKKTRNKNQS